MTESPAVAPRKPESRVKKSLLNARVNLIFYCLMLGLSFFSRKIFLDYLGADFVGLTGTLGNILGMLNLAEVGIGAAIAFNLYKPIQQGDRAKIQDLVSVFGYYYHNVGLIVCAGAVVVSAFFPLIFKDSNFSFGVIYCAFYAFVASALIGYFNNYRSTLLSADQKGYLVSAYFQTCNILKCLIQLALAYYWTNYYAWIAIELSFGIINTIILNYKINRVYPWLKCSWKIGKQKSKNYPQILKSTKQVFVHKIKDFLLNQSDQILVFAFVTLKMVAYYGNYTLIIGRLSALFSTVLSSVGAGVGNLVAEGNMPKIMGVFWELSAIRYFISGLVVFTVYHLIDPFISLWLGNEYVLDRSIVALLMITVFITLTRGTVDSFNFAYGHYADTWSAWVEGVLTVGVTLLLAPKLGIAGILLGKLSCYLTIIMFWKPLYLFRDGFKRSYRIYWAGTIRFYLNFILCAVSAHFIVGWISINPYDSFYKWIIYSIILTTVFVVVYAVGLYCLCPGMRQAIQRLPIHRLRYAKAFYNHH